MRAITITLILTLTALLLVGQKLYEQGTDISKVDNIRYNESLFEYKEVNATMNATEKMSARMTNIVMKTASAVGYVMMEGMKATVEFGYYHPELDYNFMYRLARLLMIVYLLYMSLPLIGIVAVVVYAAGAWYLKRGKKHEEKG